jgi:cytochrome b involved in lipid metabolism
MLDTGKLDFMGFYKFENVQKQRFILDLFSGEDVIIMLKGENAVTNQDFNYRQICQIKRNKYVNQIDANLSS